MHMADALISPAVGVTMWTAATGSLAYCSKKLRHNIDDRRVPLMGVLGAFVFAAQMINFTIPGTGSSGHLGGGLLLAVLLGPHAALVVMASILTIQAFLFADGGLLALGCNIMNLGMLPCFIAYPLFYRGLAGANPTAGRLGLATMVAAITGLQLGALAVVLETVLSGVSDLPLPAFLLAMQPIHLAIGIVEGLVTAAVLNFLKSAEPAIIHQATAGQSSGGYKKILIGLLVTAVATGGGLSWFASSSPDGLEWSLARVTGKENLAPPSHGLHGYLAGIQKKLAIFPDYGFKDSPEPTNAAKVKDSRPVAPGTPVAGLTGGLVTLGLIVLVGIVLKRRTRGRA